MAPAKDCSHLGEILDVAPSSADTCARCLELGDSWVHLRICLTCGFVGCCDSSKNRHARRHYHETGHPIIQSFERGESWRFCYIDETELPDGKPLRA